MSLPAPLPLLVEESSFAEKSRPTSAIRHYEDRTLSPVLILEEDPRPIRGPSAPAKMFGYRVEEDDPIFTSQDLVMMPRLTKTAPAIITQSSNSSLASHFPSLAWSTRLQNTRLADLLKIIQGENRNPRLIWSTTRQELESEYGEEETSSNVFENDIAEIYKLIGKT